MTEVWFRNPHNYVREMVEVGVGNVAWDMGMLVKRGIDPVKHAQLYFEPARIPWRALLIGDQGSVELDKDHGPGRPLGVYPTWRYGEEFELLEEMIAMPVGQDPTFYNDDTIPIQQRPVKDQPHRVIVTEIPPVNQGPGKAIIRRIKELQEEYPSCIIHIHGLYSYRIAFGMGWGATDMDSRTKAQKGMVCLPSGKEMVYERTIGCPQWITMLGMRPVDLKIPRNRCIFNIKSAIWAGENWDKNTKFKSTSSSSTPDHESPTATQETTRAYLSIPVQPKPGDRQLCDTCSLQDQCKYYRDGAVCSVPGTESASLADMFKSRSADTIISALGTLMATNVRRLERGLEEENAYAEIDPEVTKLSGMLFNQGVQVAKLIDPNLRAGAKVQVNVSGGNAAVFNGSSPNSVMAGIVREFESQGIPRHLITPEMMQGLLEEMAKGADAKKTIEGTVIATKDAQ